MRTTLGVKNNSTTFIKNTATVITDTMLELSPNYNYIHEIFLIQFQVLFRRFF